MTFVSYAQNFEDVMLWRALKHVEHGFYVDVGAQHPVIDSVSKAFHEHGWRGMHIEPVPEFAELLRKDRPDETVLQLALGDVEGTLDINVLPGTGLSTFIDAYAGSHRKQHGFDAVRVTVPMLTLAQVFRDDIGRETHWLKIDVEGFEDRVLKGWDSKAFRPWIIVIEATIPGSPELNHATWEPILLAADYKFVYFDGLNRFYVAREHAELEGAFSSPPNVFDGVQLSGQASSQLCQGLLATHLASTQERDAHAARLAQDLDGAQQRAALLEAELQASRDAEVRQQAKVQQLEQALQAADGKIDELGSRAQALQDGWDASRREVVALEQQAGALEQQVGALEQQAGVLDAEVTWLQGELSAAEAKAEEHRQSTHHWWTVADSLNQELRVVYSSKSWRMTAPLRHAMRGARALSQSSVRVARRLMGLPRRAARKLLPRARQGVPEASVMAGLDAVTTATNASGPQSPQIAQPAAGAELRAKMSPRAYRILAQLQRGIDARAR